MKDDNKILKLIYTFFLGLLLAIFIGIGTNTFYESPTAPTYPIEVKNNNGELTDGQTALQVTYENKMETYNNKTITVYNRNVSIITLSAATILLVLSLLLKKKKIKIITDGVMLGGLFTLIYSLIIGFSAQDNNYSFIAATVGLIVVLYLGYHRFVRQQK